MTENQKKLFLEALSQHGIVTEAAAYAGVARSSVYRCRNLDQNFASSWSDAKEAATDRLAKAALDRALDGIEEVKYFKGEPIGSVRRYSDQLLMFLLRAYRPAIFNPKQMTAEKGPHDDNQTRQSLVKKMAKLSQEDDN